MLEECNKVIIAIGSAQELGTKLNPFRYEYRRLMIQKVFPEYFDRIIIIGINDRENPSDDESWGEYLLNTIYKNIGIKPEAIYQGIEKKHSHWFDSFDINIINIDRDLLKVSATEIREAILEENFDYYKEFMPDTLHSEFTNLRKVLKDVENN
jgi:nicotinamide mononucleotide adenylyltransferase